MSLQKLTAFARAVQNSSQTPATAKSVPSMVYGTVNRVAAPPRPETMRLVVDAVFAVTIVVEAYGKDEAVEDVEVKNPANAFVPRSELPVTERVLQGEVVPRPRLPLLAKRATSLRPETKTPIGPAIDALVCWKTNPGYVVDAATEK